MRVYERRIGLVTILDVAGELTFHENAERLKDRVSKLLGRGDKQIVLNLGDVTLVDSSGLGELVACYTTAWRNGAVVKLVNASSRIQDLLVLTKLFTIFEAYDSEEAALHSFGPTGRTGIREIRRTFSLAL